MCGFSDVRRTPDGQYVCSVCGKKLGSQFEETARAYLGPRCPVIPTEPEAGS